MGDLRHYRSRPPEIAYVRTPGLARSLAAGLRVWWGDIGDGGRESVVIVSVLVAFAVSMFAAIFGHWLAAVLVAVPHASALSLLIGRAARRWLVSLVSKGRAHITAQDYTTHTEPEPELGPPTCGVCGGELEGDERRMAPRRARCGLCGDGAEANGT